MFADNIRSKLRKDFRKSLQEHLEKIAGAGDPAFPRTEVVNQMKRTASNMYTATRIHVEGICDVAETAAVIKVCFMVGVQALLLETLKVLDPTAVVEDVDSYIIMELDAARNADGDSPAISLAYIDRLIEHFDDKFSITPDVTPPWPGRSPARNPSSARSRSDTPPRPMEPLIPAHIASEAATAGRLAAAARASVVPPPFASPDRPRAVSPTRPAGASPNRETSVPTTYDERLIAFAKLLALVGTDDNVIGQLLELGKRVEAETKERLAALAIQRAQQHYSQMTQ